MKLDDIDIYDPLVYERGGIPHEALKTLRHEDPVHWHPEPNGPGFWAILKHEDIITCSTQPNLFSPSQRSGTSGARRAGRRS